MNRSLPWGGWSGPSSSLLPSLILLIWTSLGQKDRPPSEKQRSYTANSSPAPLPVPPPLSPLLLHLSFFLFSVFCLSVKMLFCWRQSRFFGCCISKGHNEPCVHNLRNKPTISLYKLLGKSLCLLGRAQNRLAGSEVEPFQRFSVATVRQQGRQWEKVRVFSQQLSCQVGFSGKTNQNFSLEDKCLRQNRFSIFVQSNTWNLLVLIPFLGWATNCKNRVETVMLKFDFFKWLMSFERGQFTRLQQ